MLGTKASKRSALLEAIDLRVRFRRSTVLDGIHLAVESGQVVGLLGPNGAGKTTTFRAILGQVELAGGRIELEGEDISHMPMHRRALAGIGYLPQEPSVFRGLKVEENILCVLETRKDLGRGARFDEMDRLLDELGISSLRHRRPEGLSGGERRRVEIARALAAKPRYVLLDEPFAGVDPLAIGEIVRLVQFLTTKDIGVLITDHNVREALKLCDRVFMVGGGRVLASGSPEEIVKDDRVRNLYLGESFDL